MLLFGIEAQKIIIQLIHTLKMREHPTHVMKDWDIKPDFYLQIINCIERKKD